MNNTAASADILLEPSDNQRLANLCGQFDEHLRQIERRLGVEINNRGNAFRVIGDTRSVQAASEVLRGLYGATVRETLSPARVHLFLQESGIEVLLERDAGEVAGFPDAAYEGASFDTAEARTSIRAPHSMAAGARKR